MQCPARIELLQRRSGETSLWYNERNAQYADKPASMEGQWHFGSDVPTYDFLKYDDGTPTRLSEALADAVAHPATHLLTPPESGRVRRWV